MHYILHYEYVDNILEKRQPFRNEHLALLNHYVSKGEVLLGGALCDPVDSSITVFQVKNRSVVEKFVAQDPYVNNGLITNWQIREWNVVVGSCLEPASEPGDG